MQCTLKEESDLKDTSIRAAGFRGRFGAAVVAVKRNKKRVEGKIGDIVLQPHDQLVLDTGAGLGLLDWLVLGIADQLVLDWLVLGIADQLVLDQLVLGIADQLVLDQLVLTS